MILNHSQRERSTNVSIMNIYMSVCVYRRSLGWPVLMRCSLKRGRSDQVNVSVLDVRRSVTDISHASISTVIFKHS